MKTNFSRMQTYSLIDAVTAQKIRPFGPTFEELTNSIKCRRYSLNIYILLFPVMCNGFLFLKPLVWPVCCSPGTCHENPTISRHLWTTNTLEMGGRWLCSQVGLFLLWKRPQTARDERRYKAGSAVDGTKVELACKNSLLVKMDDIFRVCLSWLENAVRRRFVYVVDNDIRSTFFIKKSPVWQFLFFMTHLSKQLNDHKQNGT